jgi:uncharacterized protein (TIGR00266 family)
MNFQIQHRPDYSWLTVQVPTNEKIFVEASSMAAMSTNMNMKTKMKGGLSRLISKESLFVNEFTADGYAGEISIAPGPQGDIGHFQLNQNSIYLASSSFVAHSQGIIYETKFQKLSQGLLSGAGWFLIKMSGVGDVWFNGYGAIIEMEVTDGMVVDNGHIVAFTEGVEYEIIKLGGYKSLFFSGEGFVCRFRGSGTVYVQTKKPAALIQWAHHYRRVQKNNN